MCLPDPEKIVDPEIRRITIAANEEVIETLQSVPTAPTSVTRNGVKRKTLNHHYSPEIRAQIGRHALEYGNASAARRFSIELNFNVGESTVRAIKKKFLASTKKSTTPEEITELEHAKRGRPLLLGDLDGVLTNHVREIREAGGVINKTIVMACARGAVNRKNMSLLCENGGQISITRGWAQSFLKRMGYVKHKGLKATRTVPADFIAQKANFLDAIAETVLEFNIPNELVINFDQTGLRIVPVSNWTLADEGSKHIDIIDLEDKREITAVLGSTATGVLLPPQLLYMGKTSACHPKYDFPDDWDINHTINHWSSEESMTSYVENIIMPYVNRIKAYYGLPETQQALIICDVFRAHGYEIFRNLMRKNNLRHIYVPAGCAGELQPMNLSVNEELKMLMKSEFSDWYTQSIACDAESRVDLRLSMLKPLHAHWFVTSFYKISNNIQTVVSGWRKAGILQTISADAIQYFGDN